MPQMDPTSFPSQLFWLVVTFVSLYFVLARMLLPRIQEVLEARDTHIAHDLDRAERFRQEAAEAKDAYEKTLAESRAKAQALLKETQDVIAKDAAARLHMLDADLTRRIADAERAIATARQQAQSALTPASEELASLIVEKLVHQKPKPETISAMLDKVAKS